MSYTRRVSKRISVHYSGTISYPASEHGGTKSYSGTAYEDVVVNVHVNTDPFDSSAHSCRNHVDGLTASVAATEAAEVASIEANSRKVGKTLIDGFFKTVRSEISQQINELKNTVEATLLKLQADSRRCKEMQNQMEVDYNRKCEQYLRIFSDLDRELENRIRSLDQQTFLFRADADTLSKRLVSSDMVPTVSIAGGENALLGAQISASLTKQRAYDTLGKANRFLSIQKRTDNTITSSIIHSGSQGQLYLPVCVVEANGPVGSDRHVYCPSRLDSCSTQIGESLRTRQFGNYTDNDVASIRRYFNEEVSSVHASDPHGERVRDLIIKMFNL